MSQENKVETKETFRKEAEAKAADKSKKGRNDLLLGFGLGAGAVATAVGLGFLVNKLSGDNSTVVETIVEESIG